MTEKNLSSRAPERTADAARADLIAADATRVIDALQAGGMGVVPLDVAYAVIGSQPDAIRRIFEVKQRSFGKPSGMFGQWYLSAEIHVMDADRHRMVRELVEELGLPFSVVAKYRKDHPLIEGVPGFVLQTSTKGDTLDMLINAGALHNEIVRQTHARSIGIFGSSANRSLTGSKYRLADVEPEIRQAATVTVDHGTSRFANPEGRSSTIIDFETFVVLRKGVCFDTLQAAFKYRFDVDLKLQPGVTAGL
jgi:tRNA A37 threonylcarbamoyladenosine synthetase subunit TsaC/SUA5/YrdC